MRIARWLTGIALATVLLVPRAGAGGSEGSQTRPIVTGPPGTQVVVSDGAPRAGRPFVAMVVVLDTSAREEYRRLVFSCGSWIVMSRQRTLYLDHPSQRRRIRTFTDRDPVPSTIVCAWEIPRGTAGKYLTVGWSHDYEHRDGRRGPHVDGFPLRWKIVT